MDITQGLDRALERAAELARDRRRSRSRARRTLLVSILCLIALFALEAFMLNAYGRHMIAITVTCAIPVLMVSRTGEVRWTYVLAIISVLGSLSSLVLFESQRDASTVDRAWSVIDEIAASFALFAAATLGLRRERTERALRTTREISEATLDTIHEAVITVDPDHRITQLNQAAAKLTGWQPSEALGLPLDDVLTFERDRRTGEDSVVAEGPSLKTGDRKILRTKQGRLIPVESDSIAMRGKDGESAYGHVIVFRDASERQRFESEIKRLAYRDELTQLPNRTSFWDRLQLELQHAEREKKMLGLLYLDLDGFKAVNDTLGHRAGDDLLKGVAERLRRSIRRGDTVARLGGDEFCVILPGVKGAADAERVAAKLVSALEEPIQIGRDPVRTRPSIGIALYPQDAKDAEELVHCADQAMYEAKHGGGHGRR